MKIKDLIAKLQTLDGEQELWVVDEEYMDAGPIGANIEHSSVRYNYNDGMIPYSDGKKGYVI